MTPDVDKSLEDAVFDVNVEDGWDVEIPEEENGA